MGWFVFFLVVITLILMAGGGWFLLRFAFVFSLVTGTVLGALYLTFGFL